MHHPVDEVEVGNPEVGDEYGHGGVEQGALRHGAVPDLEVAVAPAVAEPHLYIKYYSTILDIIIFI